LTARKNLPLWGSPQPRGTDCASALKCQAFGGEGVGGRAEKLKLGKQKAESARRSAPRSAAVSYPPHLPVPCALSSHFCFLLSRFQLFFFLPVEQFALGLLLAGGDFD
jgi:hypothetical protein